MKTVKRHGEHYTGIVEYGDPGLMLEEVDKALKEHNLEIVLIDNGCSDFYFRIEKRSENAAS
jgi:sugar phosphate isomerase/epimerase